MVRTKSDCSGKPTANTCPRMIPINFHVSKPLLADAYRESDQRGVSQLSNGENFVQSDRNNDCMTSLQTTYLPDQQTDPYRNLYGRNPQTVIKDYEKPGVLCANERRTYARMQ